MSTNEENHDLHIIILIQLYVCTIHISKPIYTLKVTNHITNILMIQWDWKMGTKLICMCHISTTTLDVNV